MKYQSQSRQYRYGMSDQRGFSLVEVLICIALLVLICVPLFSAIRLSADNSRRAHHTQMETEYAQEVMETIKSTDVAAFLAEIDAEPDGEVPPPVLDTAAKAKFSGYDSGIYGDELFEVLTCTQSNINIGGRLYDMEIKFNPVIYSELDADAGDKASNANTFTSVNINEIDGLKFPVISDEINQYESDEINQYGVAGETTASAVLYNLLAQAKAEQLKTLGDGDETDTKLQLSNIYKNTVKTVVVKISNGGATETYPVIGGVTYVKNSIKVICDIAYETTYNGVSLKQVYNVYSGIFELKGKMKADSSGVERWESGGNVYIFARAYDEKSGIGAGYRLAGNNIVIQNDYTGTGDINVYLVEGRYEDGTGVHFNNVKVEGSNYCNLPSNTEKLSGEEKYGNTQFHTNIKGMFPDIVIYPGTTVSTIGKDKPRLRCYEVLLILTKQETGQVVSRITSTKNL